MLLHNLLELQNHQSMVSILLEQFRGGLVSLLKSIEDVHTIEQGRLKSVRVRGGGLDLECRSDVVTIWSDELG